MQAKARKSAPLPARDFCSYLAKIRRNREARERFADLLLLANAREARKTFIYWCAPFCRNQKICKARKFAVVPSKFCLMQNFHSGRRKKFWFIQEVTSPINPAGIFAFFATFFSKKKVDTSYERRSLSNKKAIFCKIAFCFVIVPLCGAFRPLWQGRT